MLRSFLLFSKSNFILFSWSAWPYSTIDHFFLGIDLWTGVYNQISKVFIALRLISGFDRVTCSFRFFFSRVKTKIEVRIELFNLWYSLYYFLEFLHAKHLKTGVSS
jgi:hypothetical protein